MSAPIPMRHPKPIVPRPLVMLFTTCLVFAVLFSAFISLLHSRSMYAHITDPLQQQENGAIISYLTGPLFAQNDLGFLTPAERQHMSDVKRIYDVAYILDIVAIGVLLGITLVFVWQKLWQRLDELVGRSLRASGWTILLICFLLGAMALLNFTKFWVLFHLLLFPQGNWAFPADSILITLYPSRFFERFVTQWFLSITTFAIVAILLSYLSERMRHAEHVFRRRK